MNLIASYHLHRPDKHTPATSSAEGTSELPRAGLDQDTASTTAHLRGPASTNHMLRASDTTDSHPSSDHRQTPGAEGSISAQRVDLDLGHEV
jgi:hypothetical protein